MLPLSYSLLVVCFLPDKPGPLQEDPVLTPEQLSAALRLPALLEATPQVGLLLFSFRSFRFCEKAVLLADSLQVREFYSMCLSEPAVSAVSGPTALLTRGLHWVSPHPRSRLVLRSDRFSLFENLFLQSTVLTADLC
jgi:hypothetical protein